ncbi:unnamed protein product [Dibothriocephalus latus]|uniref:Uncharacterized protein n=1 Tax=Dibothriocephalus latus TaxID=60516 RepID=A0A3P7MKR9_DIBLA|nr:unnamed protein product [Dibothriocephalus latus]
MLYTEILRVYEDSNQKNKDLILEIMEFCKANAPVRLPIFEADAITALELYNARAGGLKVDGTATDKTISPGAAGATVATPGTATPKRLSIVVQPNLLKDPNAASSVEEEIGADDSYSYDSEMSAELELVRKSAVPARLPSILNFARPPPPVE